MKAPNDDEISMNDRSANYFNFLRSVPSKKTSYLNLANSSDFLFADNYTECIQL